MSEQVEWGHRGVRDRDMERTRTQSGQEQGNKCHSWINGDMGMSELGRG